MSWCNIFRRTVLDYCENDNFPGTFGDFCLKLFTEERISLSDDPCP